MRKGRSDIDQRAVVPTTLLADVRRPFSDRSVAEVFDVLEFVANDVDSRAWFGDVLAAKRFVPVVGSAFVVGAENVVSVVDSVRRSRLLFDVLRRRHCCCFQHGRTRWTASATFCDLSRAYYIVYSATTSMYA